MTTELALAGASGVPMTREEIEKTVSFLAKEYRESLAHIRTLLVAVQDETERLQRAFATGGRFESYNRFEVDVRHGGDTYDLRERDGMQKDIDRLEIKFRRQAWRILMDKIQIVNIMSIAEREKFENQLEKGDLPPVTEEAIYAVLGDLSNQAGGFAQRAAVEVLELLRSHDGKYKTNSAFKLGKRAILTYQVSRSLDGKGYRVNYTRSGGQALTAIDAVFHLLDGKGVLKEHRGPLVNAIDACVGGKGETEYFRFKCFQNGNLHLEFKNLELEVKQLNIKGMGKFILGDE